jgi:ABC-2 type transport system permease protein
MVALSESARPVFSALVRPLVWLAIFATGFHFVLGVLIIPPYETHIPYAVYIAPGLIAMILMFNGMLSSLSMVYDREMGSMRILMVGPLPRWFLLTAKLLARVRRESVANLTFGGESHR